MPVLEVMTGDLEGRSYLIDEDVFSIGRRNDNDLVVPKKHFSRRHAEILCRNGAFFVVGLSVKNPIFQDENEHREIELRDGSEFEICDVRFRFRAGKGVSGALSEGRRRPTQEKHRFDSVSGEEEDSDDDTEALAAQISAVRQRGGGAAPTSVNFDDEDDDFGEPMEEETPREKFVFGADEGDFDSDEKTGLINVNMEDSDEKTGMIDLLDMEAPKANPFEERLKAEAKSKEEGQMKILVILGGVGILLALSMLLFIDRGREPIERVNDVVFVTGRGQTIFKEIDFQSTDPPVAFIVDGVREGARAAAWVTIVDDENAKVEWVLPRNKGRALILITGKKDGATEWTFEYQQYKDTKTFKIECKGPGPRERERKRRMDGLAGKTIQEVKETIKVYQRSGDQLWTERDTGGSEANYSRAREFYQRAQECIEILKTKILKTIDSEFYALEKDIDERNERAAKGYKQFYDKQKARYSQLAAQGKTAEEKRQLEVIMRTINDTRDRQYKKFKIFRENYYER